MGVTLQEQFRQLKEKDGPRYVVITGGRGSAKSFGVSTVIADRVCSPGHRVLYSRLTMVSAHLSVIPEVVEKMDLLGVRSAFQVNKREIVNTLNGSDIIFRGLKTSSGDQTAALKSIQGVSTWVLDEAEELTDEATFDKIDLSIRTQAQKNQIILILNPTTTDHWIWERWFEYTREYIEIDGCRVAMSTHPDILHLHFTYLTNRQYLDAGFVANIERLKVSDPRKYAHRIIGGWAERAEGAVFTNWQPGQFDPGYPKAYGLDYGYFPDPSACIEVAADSKQKRLFLREHFYETELSAEQIAERLREATQGVRRALIVSDTSEPRTTAKIRAAGFQIEPAHKRQIVDDIRDLEDWTLIVDPDSYNLIKELNNYTWNDKRKSVPVDDYNHLLDAMRYVWRRLTTKGRGLRRVN